MSQDGMAEKALEVGAEHVIVVDRWHGGPGKINLYITSSTGLKPVSPVMLLSGIRLRREITESTSRIKSSVITVEPKDSPNLEKVAASLSRFFGLPIVSLTEASKSSRGSMHLSVDSSRKLQITFMLTERMVEIGPRVTLSKLVWEVQS
jgi:rRNA maturation protein Rpf1